MTLLVNPRSRSLQVLAAVALCAGALAGCGNDSSADPDDSGTESTHVVTTPQGKVDVPDDPERVVVLNHALAGYLYELDVPVTAITPEVADSDEREFSPFWEDQAEEAGTEFLPWTSNGYSMESILEMDPDLIIGGGLGFPYAQAVEAYDDLSKIAPTVLVDDKLGTWQEQFSFLAEDVFDDADRFAQLEKEYEDRVAEVKNAITIPPTPVAYLSFTSDNVAYGVVESTGLPQELARLGFKPAPIFERNDLPAYGGTNDMFEISPEIVDEVITAPTVFTVGFNGDTVDLDALRKDPIYAALPAFENDNVYDLPYWTLRADYHETMGLLDHIEKEFG